MTLDRDYNTSVLENGLEKLHIDVSREKIDQLLKFYEMLIKKNEVMNLTAITDYEEVVVKHFLDSVSITKLFVPTNEKIIDVGCGAGFPGLPLKIVFPDTKVTLLDSLNKRVIFLREIIDELGLKDIEAVHGRAEDFAANPSYREKYDISVSRAVANMTTLSEYCLPFVKKGGCFVAYKSEKGPEEMEQAHKAIDDLGGKLSKEESFALPDTDILRNIYMIEKIKGTPSKYPRKAGLPSKEPIGWENR